MTTKKQPVRMCSGCSQRKLKKELIRVVKTPDGEILLDMTGKKAGRGAYICSDTGCLMKARKKRAFERAFETDIAPEVYERLEGELNKK